jgi:hypothetical protein
MKDTIRIGVAQIDFLPAYISEGIDFLDEPLSNNFDLNNFNLLIEYGNFILSNELRQWKDASKMKYIDFFQIKVNKLLEFFKSENIDVVFYS